ncbi:hypothetical protein PoB_002606500 [Plakobranchus ocellatus]|uniref:Uncharacterized protein n=1 Tax=Plakobranchus ocellatus TaxID=259542 RepID=A0AAV3ZUP4_9GAST|nr:hypothetical protein PoB_002606500 [Plakobranchus ocellatus]
MAAAKSTLESAWRPPKLLKSLSGSRRNDSVYAKTTLAQGRIASLSGVRVTLACYTGESKGGEESNGKLPHKKPYAKNNPDYSWFPNAWTKHGTHFILPHAHEIVPN